MLRLQRSRGEGRRSARLATRTGGHWRSLTAGGVTVGLALASIGGGAAFAAAEDRAEAEGVLLSGEGIIDLDTVADIDGAYSDYLPGGEVAEALDLTALGLLNVQVGASVIPLNQLLDLGVAEQYARTDAGGAFASAGAIAGNGAIAVGGAGPAADTTVTLAPLLATLGVDGVVEDVALNIGAVAAQAQADRTAGRADITSDYEIAGGTVTIDAPAIGDIVTALEGTLDDASADVNGTVGALDDLLGGIVDVIDSVPLVTVGDSETTVDLDLDLGSVVAALSDAGPATSGAVTVDLGEGTVTVDLDSLVAGGLNGNASGATTELISSAALSAVVSDAVIDVIDTALPGAIAAALNTTELELGVATTLVGGLASVDVTITGSLGSFLGNAGQPAPVVDIDADLAGIVPIGAVLDPVGDFVAATLLPAVGDVLETALDLPALTDALDTALTTAVDTLDPVFDLVATILSVQIGGVTADSDFVDPNGLDGAGYTRQALRIAVADELGAGLLVLNLASATVRADALAPPAGLAIDPTRGPVTGGTEVTITGDNLTDVTEILFGSVPVADFTVNADGSITTTAPAQTTPGTVAVSVTNPDGTDDSLDFEYFDVASVDSITPDSGSTDGGDTVTIVGDCLADATAVLFDGVPGTDLTVVSDTELTVTTPAGTTGAVDVTIETSDPDCGDVTVDDGFTYVVPGAPTLSDIDPAEGPETGGTTVVITGTDFTGTESVTFDGVEAESFVVDGDTQITAVTPAGTPGVVDVIVTNAAGASAGFDFEYIDVAEIDDVDPGIGPEAGGNTVTIIGDCFTDATDVLFGGTPATSFVVVSDTEITAVVPAGTGVVDVTVVTSGTCGEVTDDDGYEYVPAPIVTGLTPTEGPETGGTVVTIEGEGFEDATGVTFDGEPGTDFTVVDDNTITVTTPPGTPGTAPVTVLHPGGDTDAGGFLYLDVPSITGIAPDEGPEDGGTVVTVTGEGFTGATGVEFDGIPGTSFTVVSDTEITVTTPAHAPGTVDVIVLHPNGDSEPVDFTYIEGTEIDDVTPPGGPEEGGTEVTIIGSCFTDATAVLFGTTPATSFEVVSDTEIVATAPAGVGTVDVTVVGSDACGTETLPDGFEYTDAPVIGTITPAEGPETGGTVVTITGGNLGDTTTVFFGGVPGTALEVISDTEIRVTTPAGSPGAVDVVVASPDGSSDPGVFTYLPVGDSTDPGDGTGTAPGDGTGDGPGLGDGDGAGDGTGGGQGAGTGGGTGLGSLPSTGGDGSALGMTLMAALMLIAAGAVALLRRRRTA